MLALLVHVQTWTAVLDSLPGTECELSECICLYFRSPLYFFHVSLNCYVSTLVITSTVLIYHTQIFLEYSTLCCSNIFLACCNVIRQLLIACRDSSDRTYPASWFSACCSRWATRYRG
jgi:Na+/melibiose symporter-like transporter